MNTRIFEQTDTRRWKEFVENNSKTNCYHQIEWKEIIEKSFGHKAYYLYSENENGRITGIAPLVHLKSFMFGSFMVSLPYFNYGGICADDEDTYSFLLNESVNLARRKGASHIEFRETSSINNSLQKKQTKVSMTRPLPKSSDALWTSIGSKLRSQIKRPEREGMYFKIGREEELNAFYEVFCENMRDLGTPVYSINFFLNVLKTFPSSWICSVYTKGNKPVAAGFLVGFKDTLEIPWASSLRNYNSLSPNMLLYWSCLKFACDSGYKVFDFGRSTPNEGTYKFKEQWGAKPLPLYWYYWMQDDKYMPELNTSNPKFTLAIHVWQRLPVGLTKILGPMIVRNIP